MPIPKGAIPRQEKTPDEPFDMEDEGFEIYGESVGQDFSQEETFIPDTEIEDVYSLGIMDDDDPFPVHETNESPSSDDTSLDNNNLDIHDTTEFDESFEDPDLTFDEPEEESDDDDDETQESDGEAPAFANPLSKKKPDETPPEPEVSFKERVASLGEKLAQHSFMLKVLGLLDKIGMSVVKPLQKLPKSGSLLSVITSKAWLLRLVGIVIPLAISMMFIVFVRFFTYPDSVEQKTIELPDDGKVIANYSINDESVSVELSNEGAIIAEVNPNATVSSTRLLNPVTWFVSGSEVECTAPETKVEIGEKETITLKCTEAPKGFSKVLQGSIS